MVVARVLAASWFSAWSHSALVAALVVVLLLVLLLLLLVRRRRQAPKLVGVANPVDLPEPQSGAPTLEGLAGQVEVRLQATLERLKVEERRLDERQAAVSVNEHEFERTAEERIARLTEWERTLQERAADIDSRARAVEEAYRAREAELASHAADLATREAALARRTAELAVQDRLPAPGEPSDIAEREQAIAARIANVSQREIELARRAAALAVREKEIERVAAGANEAAAPAPAPPKPEPEALAAPVLRVTEPPAPPVPEPPEAPPAPEPPPAVPPQPAAAQPPPAPPGPTAPEPVVERREIPKDPEPLRASEPRGRWNVLALDRLVEQRGAAFPDRLEEWSSYLYSLRAYASPDGTLPASFDTLVEETFAPLVKG